MTDPIEEKSAAVQQSIAEQLAQASLGTLDIDPTEYAENLLNENVTLVAENARLTDDNARLVNENKAVVDYIGDYDNVANANDKLTKDNARLTQDNARLTNLLHEMNNNRLGQLLGEHGLIQKYQINWQYHQLIRDLDHKGFLRPPQPRDGQYKNRIVRADKWASAGRFVEANWPRYYKEQVHPNARFT